MNKEWAEMNKTLQLQIKRKDTFATGIDTLLELRKKLMEQIMQFRNELSDADFCAMPYMNAKGYHNKTIAYSLWHIFRIEDIVAHSLIANDEQILFKGDYQSRIKTPIITTANELIKEKIGEFSKKLSIEELYNYIADVDEGSFSPAFVNALIYAMAAEFSMCLLDDATKFNLFYRLYNSELREARFLDSVQESPKQINDFSLVDVRF